MGRLTLNVLLSFAQFEREIIGERVRDKIAASERKGLWVGGPVPLSYRSVDKVLEIVPQEAELVKKIFSDYLRLGSVGALAASLTAEGLRPKPVSWPVKKSFRQPATASVPSPIFSGTGSTSARSPIAAKSMPGSTSPFSSAICSTPSRPSSPTSGCSEKSPHPAPPHLLTGKLFEFHLTAAAQKPSQARQAPSERA